MEYLTKRSKRKTLAIHITKNGLEVRAPLKMSQRYIDSFVSAKANWIQKKLEYMESLKTSESKFKIDYGSTILFMGRDYIITALDENEDQRKIYLSDNEVKVAPGKTETELKACLISFYKAYAKEQIFNRVKYYCRIMKIPIPKVRITSAKTRWGSCSSEGNINFSWLLVMADANAIDYVVIHELAHLTHHNHSEKFWKLVKKYCPEFWIHIKTLITLGKKLQTEDWK